MILALSILFLSVPWMLEAYLDLKDAKAGIEDQKTRDIWELRAPAMVLCAVGNALIFPNEFPFFIQLVQGLGLSLGLFVLCFDMAFGIGFKKNPFYLGTTSKTDWALSRFNPIVLLILRLIVFTFPILIYTQLDYIIQ